MVHELERLARHRAQLVGSVEPLGGVGDQPPGRQRVEALALAPGAQHGEQRLALEVLHRDEVAAIGLAEIVDVDDVRVLDQRCDSRLVEQHVDERLLRRERIVDELDDDELLEPVRSALDRELDIGHATLADARDELVASEPDRAGWIRRTRVSWLALRRARPANRHVNSVSEGRLGRGWR